MSFNVVVATLEEAEDDELFTTAIDYTIKVSTHNRGMTESERIAVRNAVQETLDLLSVKVSLIMGRAPHLVTVSGYRESSSTGTNTMHPTGVVVTQD